jgi:bifunctional non-homologous end joining protein LigD
VLEDYKHKRDFEKTPEPAGSQSTREGRLIFVIHKHAATRLHYDFRLELDGVLKSWPIPKGPSLDPADKRLAVMTEDHPLDYASFEGVIPKGQYGAGQVIVWDAGTYSPDEQELCFDDREEASRQMREGLATGKVSVFLQGQKLKGSFALVKTSRGENEWLFIKHADRFADSQRDITLAGESVISGLTIEAIKAGHLPDRARNRLYINPADLPGAVAAPLPTSVEPMQGNPSKSPFSSPDWLFEPKMDGVRAIVRIDGDNVRVTSRRGVDTTKQYPGIAAEMAEQTERRMILDGEIVALDAEGRPSFQAIQQRLNLQRASDISRAESEVPVYLYVFDLLHAGGYDLRGARLTERKTLLSQLLIPTDHVHLLNHFDAEGDAAFEAAMEHGFEGVVAKRRDSLYESGRRASTWLKIKATTEDEFVVGGFTRGEGGRSRTFGSLLVGQYDDEGRLVYAGNVGTGFDDRTLAALRLRLDSIAREETPFDIMAAPSNRFGRKPEPSDIIWTEPEIVARVEFAEWTKDGHLRAPSFKGLRGDKAPEEARRQWDVPVPVSEPAAGSGNDTEIADVIKQLEADSTDFKLKVMGETVALTNLDKVFWPAWGDQRALTKRDLLLYFAQVSPHLLRHMRDRPITLTRYPNGITKGHFYQKHWEPDLPRFVESVRLWSGQNEEDGEYLLCNNLPTLMWLGQLADIELHTWYSRVSPHPDGDHLPETYAGSSAQFDRSRLNFPDFIVFDLDPYIYSGEEAKGAEPELNSKAFEKTCDVALWLKELLDTLSLSSFVKTTGKTGLHIYVPIVREFDYGTVRAAAETIGKFLLRAHPRTVTMDWSVPKRKGKVFFDHNQNAKGKTLASIYSPRPVPWAGVSMPVAWGELRDVYPASFTILTAPERIARTGDLWERILDEKHDLDSLLS